MVYSTVLRQKFLVSLRKILLTYKIVYDSIY